MSETNWKERDKATMTVPAQDVQALMEKIRSLPSDRIAEVDDFVDFLRLRKRQRKITMTEKESMDFPVDDLGPWPESLNLSRAKLYGDDER